MNDLTWLARNVHEWPKGLVEGLKCKFTIGENEAVGIMRNHPEDWPNNGGWQTKENWIAERARLQNKPSVDKWPEWVNWIAQWSDGQWIGYDVEPEKGNIDEPNDCYVHPSHEPNIYYFEYGELLGDWRDTLEKRPEQMTPPIHANHRCVQVTIDDTERKEWKQGEFPPVGTVCELSIDNNDPYTKGHVSFYGDQIFVWVTESGSESSYAKDWAKFRPLKNEEEKSVDDMASIISDINPARGEREVAKALYRSGYRKLDKPDASN